ncbi:beta-carotene 15,15'-monooxygenase [Kingella kingae]|uniref:beta-carotene 15,15'-monooxygenase n=4 Tax=Kingella kingae TaxID=504 RepID=UPI00254E6454|nr:beta-carotene 15,15'-monooxygenase [Kingella kingae]MDK4555905.1 beta-carotene 15,15'-monooxygenase [Kingella kingae]MDK4585026.1 beta-carotene 15,15'-monooxygenase [Kingella kingae]MDK4589014.1 beta-carotene 15,15'-monooxygenase [Kingella kingae]MDK4611091.1 beta-carotene 15,15'-monooxygenase [Kingella kingae]MDK4658845.1 beta-carotene 15,15'-monooxygenase [Kingella kingae]
MKKAIQVPKIYVNAEFQRLLWLNFGWGLLAGIVLMYALFLLSVDYGKEYWQENWIMIGSGGMGFAAISAYVLIERSLKQDIASNTFDQLRMSALSPWQMAYSRILVAPIMSWIAFAIGWLITLVYLAVAKENFVSIEGFSMIIWLPMTAWAFACVVLINALSAGRGNSQWSGAAVQLILLFSVCSVFMGYFADALNGVRKVHTWADIAFLYFNDGIASIPTWVKTWFSTLLITAFASVGAWAAMAQRLHLRLVRHVFLGLSLASPLVLIWVMLISGTAAAITIAWCYAVASILSIACQKQSVESLQQGFEYLLEGRVQAACYTLPAWVFLLPIGLLFAFGLDLQVALVFALHIILFAALVLLATSLRSRYNSITAAMVWYLLANMLWAFAT